jgi:hypothetical protein
MNNYIIKLIRVLETLLDRHKNLLKLCHEQKQALIANDIAKLGVVIQKMNRLTDEIAELEENRIAVAADAALLLDIDPDEGTIMAILERVIQDIKVRVRFNRVRSELKDVIYRIQETNQIVEKLTHQSMDYTIRLLKLASSTGSGKSCYGSSSAGSIGGYFINLRT